jgi:hypothetical protein
MAVGAAAPTAAVVAMSFRAGATRVDVLVCIALEEEFAIARSVFARSTGVETEAPEQLSLGPAERPLAFRWAATTRTGKVTGVTVSVGRGAVDTSLATARLCESLNPRSLALLGISGALSQDLILADVHVPEAVDAFLSEAKARSDLAGAGSSSAAASTSLVYGGRVSSLGRDVVADLRALPEVHPELYGEWRVAATGRARAAGPAVPVRDTDALVRGGAASSGLVIACDEFARHVRDHRDRNLMSADTESDGFMASLSKVADVPQRVLVVRGISDLAYVRHGKAATDAVTTAAGAGVGAGSAPGGRLDGASPASAAPAKTPGERERESAKSPGGPGLDTVLADAARTCPRTTGRYRVAAMANATAYLLLLVRTGMAVSSAPGTGAARAYSLPSHDPT